jgi:ferredoxin
VVSVSGIYLFLVYQYGFDTSYLAVERMESRFISRTVRAIHRYASGALVITTLLHAFRTLFLEQFHGPRWLPWVTGVGMTGLIWLAGLTGYWLPWDARAQTMTERLIAFLQTFGNGGAALQLYLLRAEADGRSWPILLSILGLHVVLTLLIGLLFWYHLQRLSRPRWLPEFHWMIGMGVVLLVGALAFPVGLLPQASFTEMAGRIEIDPIFLFYLPLPPGAAVFLWSGLALAGVLAVSLPWLPSLREIRRGKSPEPPKVRILNERCTGCTKCALDCPYDAIQMVERHDSKPHKYIAIADRDLCVSCGICVGSCDGLAVSLGADPPELLWQTIALQMNLSRAAAPDEPLRLVLTCDRHFDAAAADGGCVVPLPCAGAAPPDLLTRALAAGAAAVVIVGCPPNDCVNREGNLWTAQRLLRERVPRLKRAYENAPITAVWAAPNEARDIMREAYDVKRNPYSVGDDTPLSATDYAIRDTSHPDYTKMRDLFQTITWRNLLVSFGLLALVLGLQIGLTQRPLLVHAADTAVAQIVLADAGASLGANRAKLTADEIYQLQLWVDGRLRHETPFTGGALINGEKYLHEIPLTPGAYRFDLRLVDETGRARYTLLTVETAVTPRQIVRLTYAPRFWGVCAGVFCIE